MAEAFEFEVRPIEGVTAVVGEEVTFKEEGGKLYALNEDGEPFGVVPAKFVRQLEGLETATATVASRSGGVPTVAVEVSVEPTPEDAASTAPVEAAAGAEEDQAEAPDESEQEPEMAASALEVETESKVEATQGETDADKIESAESDAPAAQNDAAADAPGKKKSKATYIAIAAVAAVVIVIIVCVGLFSGEKTQTVTSDWLSIEVPEDWTVETLNEDAEPSDSLYCVRHIYSDEPGFYVYIGGPQQIDEEVQTQYEYDEEYEEWLYGAEKVDDFTIDGAVVQQYEVDSTEISLSYTPDDYELTDDSTEWAGYVYYVYSGSEYIVLRTYCLADEYDEDVGELEDILDSVVLEDASEPEAVMQTVTSGEISIEVPAGWTVESEASDSSDIDNLVMAYRYDYTQVVFLQGGYSLSGKSFDYFLTLIEANFGLDTNTLEKFEDGNGVVICRYEYSGDELVGYAEVVFSGDFASVITVVCTEDELAEDPETLESILDSVTIENPSEPDFS